MTLSKLAQVEPEEVGFSSVRLERLAHGLEQCINADGLAGTVSLVALHNKIVHYQALGCADREPAVAMMPDSIFRIFSMTKPVTSLALLLLYEEGGFRLNEAVERYIPQFAGLQVYHDNQNGGIKVVAPVRPMTIRDLLIHTAGLT